MTTRRFGEYHVQQKIGAGALGTVYRAQTAGGQAVTLKILHPALAADPQAVEAFLLVIKRWSAFTHAHLLPLLDAGVLRDRPYTVTALAAGGSLTAHFATPTVMSLQHSARMLRQISSALEYLHRQGADHSRLKLSNIVIDAGGNWLLTDVGMTAVQSAAELPADFEQGHFAFPQEAQGKQADLYGLAVLTYLLTSGQMPYRGATTAEVEDAHRHTTAARPTQVNPALAREMDAVLLRGLAKQPGSRYLSADAFVEAYTQAIGAGRPTAVEIVLDAAFVSASGALPISAVPPAPSPQNTTAPAVVHTQAAPGDPALPTRISQTDDKPPTEPVQPLKRVRRQRKRTVWGVMGVMGMIILSITSVYIVFNIAGIGGEILNFLTGDQPVGAIDGTPVDLIEEPVLVVPPSQSEVMRSEDTQTNSLTEGHVHEYRFEANTGDEVLIGVQFFSPTAVNVPRNVAVFAPDGGNADRFCERQQMLDAVTGVGIICRISSTGTWTVRIFGREGESTGAYAVSLVVN